MTEKRRQEEGDLRAFVETIRGMNPPVYRPSGTTIFNPSIDTL